MNDLWRGQCPKTDSEFRSQKGSGVGGYERQGFACVTRPAPTRMPVATQTAREEITVRRDTGSRAAGSERP